MMHQQTFLKTLLSISLVIVDLGLTGAVARYSRVDSMRLMRMMMSSSLCHLWWHKCGCRWPKIMRGRPASRLFGTTYPAQGTTVFRWPGQLLNLPASELQFSCMYIPIELAATVYLHSNLLVIALQPDNIYIVLLHIGNSYNYCVRLQCCYCTMIRYLVRYLSVM